MDKKEIKKRIEKLRKDNNLEKEFDEFKNKYEGVLEILGKVKDKKYVSIKTIVKNLVEMIERIGDAVEKDDFEAQEQTYITLVLGKVFPALYGVLFNKLINNHNTLGMTAMTIDTVISPQFINEKMGIENNDTLDDEFEQVAVGARELLNKLLKEAKKRKNYDEED